MNMYSIQNLTNSTIKFQGVAIGAYMTVCVPTIYDYVKLSQLTNAGKIRHFMKPTVKSPVKPVVEEKVEPSVKNEDKQVEKLVVDNTPKKEFGLFPVKEEKKETAVNETVVDFTKETLEQEIIPSEEPEENVSFINSVEDFNVEDQTKTSKRGRKSKK